ncbi:MAG TPA: nucleotidyltransferase family protein [Terriglobales bacterium]|nr:nucleotidyltransferase family protein [Terriglobales bacterium]
MGLAGTILAAGESTRMGREKALLPWPASTQNLNSSLDPALPAGTLLSAAIEAFSQYCDLVIVVVGKNQAKLAPVVYSCGAFLAVNTAPERGQFSSLQIGLNEVINRGRDAAMITLVDRPPARTATLNILSEAFETRERKTWAVIPEFQGRHGHPILIGIELIELFRKSPATANARDLEHANQQHIAYLPVDDSRVTMNINTPEDYAALASGL